MSAQDREALGGLILCHSNAIPHMGKDCKVDLQGLFGISDIYKRLQSFWAGVLDYSMMNPIGILESDTKLPNYRKVPYKTCLSMRSFPPHQFRLLS